MSDLRIRIKATERPSGEREPVSLSTKVPKHKRLAFRRGSMLLKWWRRHPKRVSAEEQARRDAEYAADYERWLAEQGYDTRGLSEREGDPLLSRVSEDGEYRS